MAFLLFAGATERTGEAPSSRGRRHFTMFTSTSTKARQTPPLSYIFFPEPSNDLPLAQLLSAHNEVQGLSAAHRLHLQSIHVTSKEGLGLARCVYSSSVAIRPLVADMYENMTQWSMWKSSDVPACYFKNGERQSERNIQGLCRCEKMRQLGSCLHDHHFTNIGIKSSTWSGCSAG